MQPQTARTDKDGDRRDACPTEETSLSGIGVAILAGGLGTRLRSVVADRSKVIAEVNGRPFLSYILDHLAAAGFAEAVLCTGYGGAGLEKSLGDNHSGLRLRYSHETEPRGTAGALRLALPQIEAGDWLVLNGDSFCDADLPAFCRFHRQSGAKASLVLTHTDDPGRFGLVEVLPTKEIAAFREKVPGAAPGWVNAGIYLISRPLLAQLPEGRSISLERDCFPTWVGHGLFGYQSGGRFLDIGTPESYGQAAAFFADRTGLVSA